MKRIFAFYFPQFYSIPENDQWWGAGFTDWNLVKNATPNFPNHYQPRVPALGYLDQSKPETIEIQGRLAAKYGISGFNFYHYWFENSPLLDAPLENLYANQEIPMQFMLTWANESWTRQWVGKPNEYLLEQKYQFGKTGWLNHYSHLSKFFKDSRYLKVDNSPVFCIYRPELIPDLRDRLNAYENFATADGFDGIHLLACRSYDIVKMAQWMVHFNGIINFNPRYTLNRHLRKQNSLRVVGEKIMRFLPERVQSRAVSILNKSNHFQMYNYFDFMNFLKISDDSFFQDIPCYSSIFPDWDNTARYGKGSTLFSSSTPNLFAEALKISEMKLSNKHQPWLFINAWNEWSEGAYLEPDLKNGYGFLEAIKNH